MTVVVQDDGCFPWADYSTQILADPMYETTDLSNSASQPQKRSKPIFIYPPYICKQAPRDTARTRGLHCPLWRYICLLHGNHMGIPYLLTARRLRVS